MAFLEAEVLVVFVKVVFVHPGRKPADDDELSVVILHASCAVHQLGQLMFRKLGEGVGIIDINPRIRRSRWQVELAEVRRHIDAAVVIAEIAVMTGHRHPLEHKAVVVSFHQRIGPAPIDAVLAIGADSLEMARISALAGRGMKVIGGTNAVQAEKSESEKDVSHHFPERVSSYSQSFGSFVYQMMKALGKKNLRLTVFCDNANAVSWLNRKEARHWSTVTGVNAAVVDSKLSTLQSVSEAAKISLTIKQVPSEANISDALSRIPLYMLPPKDQILAETPESADCMVIRIPRQLESIQRNSDGLIELQPTDAKVEYLMKTLHEHEGAHALYERMRRIVNVPRLRALCREYVSKCKDCQLSKVSANAEARAAPVLKNMDGSDFLQSGDTPWRVVHMVLCARHNFSTVVTRRH